MTTTELYNTFVSFAEQGDEAGARSFLIEHLNEFPEEIKEKIAFAFFTDALISDAHTVSENVKAQEEGKKLLTDLDQLEQVLKDAVAANDIKESI